MLRSFTRGVSYNDSTTRNHRDDRQSHRDFRGDSHSSSGPDRADRRARCTRRSGRSGARRRHHTGRDQRRRAELRDHALVDSLAIGTRRIIRVARGGEHGPRFGAQVIHGAFLSPPLFPGTMACHGLFEKHSHRANA
jgi:hypothetical protein